VARQTVPLARGSGGNRERRVAAERIMKVRILGCSGGIGGRHLRTTSMLVDDDILVDAGTGVADLSRVQLARIDHVFLTHSHLDHIASLPLLIDSVSDLREKPLIVYATAATLAIIAKHIFNWAIWPDFSVIPSREHAVMQYQTIETRAFGPHRRANDHRAACRAYRSRGWLSARLGVGQPGVYRRYDGQ
jgi:ribonuclease BN (tRNA processing enzyme)